MPKLVYPLLPKLVHFIIPLTKAYKKTKKDSEGIPNWFILDILIDCRNIDNEISASQGIWSLTNEWQKLLSDNPETVYYPILDRYVQQQLMEIVKFSRIKATANPYEVSFGENCNFYKECMKAFIIAVSNASLTQILLVKERLIESLSALCRVYDAHNQFVELIRLLLISHADKDIDKHIRAFEYSQNISSLNQLDVRKIINSVFLIPLENRMKKAVIILFKYFGYYFSDDDYCKYSIEFWNSVEYFTCDNNQLLNNIDSIIDAVRNNGRRIAGDQIINFIINIIMKRTPHTQKIVTLLNYIDYKELSGKAKEDLLNALLDLSKKCSKSLENYDRSAICRGLLWVRMAFPDYSNVIDGHILKYHYEYYVTDYSLEFGLPDEKGKPINHIKRLIEEAHSRNKTQGKDGCYSGYTTDPLAILSNIVGFFTENIEDSEIDPIIIIAKETLLTPTQTYTAKINAVELLLRVCNYLGIECFVKHKVDFHSTLEKMKNAYDMDFLSKDSAFILSFYLIILDIRLGNDNTADLLSTLSALNIPDYERIKMSKAVYEFSVKNNWININPISIFSFLQFALSGCRHENSEVRVISTRTLFELIRTKYQQLVCEQLSELIDAGDCIQTYEIVTAIQKNDSIDEELKRFVIQKAKASNHYLVRRAAEKGCC